MRLGTLKKLCFSMVLLGSSICLLTSCASWKSGKDGNAADGDASHVQATGLGEDGSGSTTGSDQDLTKRTYYFDYDKSEVRSEDLPAIEANADYLVNHPTAKVLVEGHTDPRGSREYNIALGERRAKAVAAILKEKGVSSSQVRLISYGSEKLASNGHSDSDYQLDRRDVLVYLQQ
jgi:peptidoglycan-associated lipoprotein